MNSTASPALGDGSLHIEMVDVRGTQLRIATRPSRGGRPPLLLLNGIGAKLEALFGFTDLLNHDLGVIVFDIPGVGGSPAPLRPFRFNDLARVIADLLDQLGHPAADVMGVSWGGALAQEFAHKRSARCRRLILASTAPGSTMIPGNPFAMMTMMNPLRYLQKDYVARNAMKMYGGRLRDNPDALGKMSEHMMGVGMSTGPMYQMMALMGWSSLPWLHQIRQPTLVLSGKDDPIVPPINGQLIARQIPNAQLMLVDCGHLFMLTLAEQIAAVVDAFLGAPA